MRNRIEIYPEIAMLANMSFTEILAEVDRLTPEERDELKVYLRTKIRPLSPEDIQRLSNKIDDKNPDNWLTLQQLKAKLGD